MKVMRSSATARSRLALEEGLKLEAYRDTVGIWTIGVGHAATNPVPVRGLLDGAFYQGPPKEGVTITLQESDRLLDLDLDESERGISELVAQELSQGQFDALVDFVHQYGLEKFANSTLLDRINFNPSSPAVLAEFMRWTRAGGDHKEYVWRRSARRCCVYTGTLIPQALWRKNGFPFAITADDKVDYAITPTIEKILAYGKQLSEKPVFDPNKPIPSTTIIMDTPAPVVPPNTPAGKGGAVADGPTPATASSLPNTGVSKPELPPPRSEGSGVVVSSKEATSAVVVAAKPPEPAESKNPLGSQTIWGGLLTALAPELDKMGNTLMGLGQTMGPAILTLGIIMVVLGRIGAHQPLSVSAPIRSKP